MIDTLTTCQIFLLVIVFLFISRSIFRENIQMKISKPLLTLYKISTKCNERQSSWNACKSWFCRPASETLSFDRIETTISSNFSHMEFTRFDLILIALSLTWLLHSRAQRKNFCSLTRWMYDIMKKVYQFQRPREGWIQSWNCLKSTRWFTIPYFVTTFWWKICLLFFHFTSLLANLADFGSCIKQAVIFFEPL